MGADSFSQNLSGQAKKFWISMKKGFNGVRSLWVVGSVEQDTSWLIKVFVSFACFYVLAIGFSIVYLGRRVSVVKSQIIQQSNCSDLAFGPDPSLNVN